MSTLSFFHPFGCNIKSHFPRRQIRWPRSVGFGFSGWFSALHFCLFHVLLLRCVRAVRSSCFLPGGALISKAVFGSEIGFQCENVFFVLFKTASGLVDINHMLFESRTTIKLEIWREKTRFRVFGASFSAHEKQKIGFPSDFYTNFLNFWLFRWKV